MIRNLIIIAVASFVLAVACFAGAAATGGRDLIEHGWDVSPAFLQAIEDDGDVSIRVGGRDLTGPDVTRDLTWSGGSQLQIDVPAEVSFTQGTVASVTISGPKGLVDRVELENGRLRFRDSETVGGVRIRYTRERLKVTIVAPGVSRFVLNGSPSLSIVAYDQPDLSISLNGSGDVTAAGKTQALTLSLAGSGEAALAALQAQNATLDLAGRRKAAPPAKGACPGAISGPRSVPPAPLADQGR